MYLAYQVKKKSRSFSSISTHSNFTSFIKASVSCLIFFLMLVLTGCASRFEKTLEETLTSTEAITRFGNPTETKALDNGHTRREWVLNESENVPARYATSWRWIGYDYDGYPVTVPDVRFVPQHTRYYSCTLVIISDQSGTILEKRYQGNACDALPFVDVSAKKTEAKASTEDSAKINKTRQKTAKGQITDSAQGEENIQTNDAGEDAAKQAKGQSVGRILRSR